MHQTHFSQDRPRYRCEHYTPFLLQEIFQEELYQGRTLKTHCTTPYHSPLVITWQQTSSCSKVISYLVFITRPFPRPYKLDFTVFEDTTCPKILLSSAPLERFGIIEFKVPNKASTPSALDALSKTKNITFSKPLLAEKVPPHNPATQHQGQS